MRVIATMEGGHIAEILHKPTKINPLWTPPWPSIEPSTYDRLQHPEYGSDDEAPLLAGILGHNICLDTFGAPSPEEAAAGIPVHGEAPVARYQASGGDNCIDLEATLTKAQLRFKRHISILSDSIVVRISEELENLSPTDRPIAWTQHVTMGPPFLARGQTQFAVTALRSKVIDSSFNSGKGMQKSGAEFTWPLCPLKDGAVSDLRVFPSGDVSSGFTTHLMDTAREQVYFLAWSPETKVLFGYMWNRADFPWLARWEENHLRTQPPWNGEGLACAMEFGVSPFVESRRQMVDRGSLFGVPSFRWLPARTKAQVNYSAFITTAESMPESVIWDGDKLIAERWSLS
ncbi:MAG TPA: hypothetical protein VG168_08525 [Bryobacteraceae bacterium]|nr:hypothetical protein [Bryobacteraceae bacterium]